MDYHERMRRYYDRLAPEYDHSIPGLGDKAEHPKGGEDMPGLLPEISLAPPARVLDVACGIGFLTRRPAGEVVGLNRSETMLEIARKRVPRATFVRGDALSVPFADRSFDRVFASSFCGLLSLPDRVCSLTKARRVAEELILVASTSEWGSSGRSERWEERVFSDGSPYEICRRYFTAEALAEALDGRILFAGRRVMAAVGR